MSRHRRAGVATRADRNEARLEILQAVNRHRIRAIRRRSFPSMPPLLGARQIQQAVFMCRQMPGLVPESTLARAGYRTRQLRHGRVSLAATAARSFEVPMDMIVDVARAHARLAA